jgi:hypothetical protein
MDLVVSLSVFILIIHVKPPFLGLKTKAFGFTLIIPGFGSRSEFYQILSDGICVKPVLIHSVKVLKPAHESNLITSDKNGSNI